MCWLLFWRHDLHFHQIIVNLIDSCYNHQFHVTCLFLFYVIITNTMPYWYDGAALAATRSPVIALIWCLIKFTTTTTTMYALMYAFIHARIKYACICMLVRMCLCIHVCIYVCAWVYLHICTYRYIYHWRIPRVDVCIKGKMKMKWCV